MIYFFDNELNMVKVTTSKNVISAVHEHELNGLILGTVETDLSYTEAFINDVDYFGYYYKDNYYLHKIKRVEHEHENGLVRITGRHIFFEDMLYGDYIRDVRPENRDALYILNQTISANTRWQTVMTDTSKLHSETYYWVPPMEVLNDLTENVGIEYEPRILFDGQNINGFQLHVANRIGEDKPIRVPFGSRVLNLKYEVDYSEIVTALYGHGKGEEVGDGYGRRINFSSVNFSRNGVVSRPGSLFMENPNVTAQYGKDDGSPKFGRIIFEDIESASELADATYEAYLEQSRPKMLFEASVVDLGDVGMGDGVLIIRREYDVYFNARIHKLMVDLLDAENADVELGDYAHFKESKVQRKTRENNNQYRRETSSRIQQLKEQFNDRFDGEVNQMREDFEQALIDAHAEIQAAEERMETLISTTRNDWTDTFDAEVAEIYRKADEDYNRIEAEITGVIDSTRNEMETNFNESVQNTREYAEQQAAERADAVRTDLETVTSGHQGMIDDLFDNVVDFNQFKTDINVDVSGLQSKVIDFDAFLGDISNITLNDRLQSINRNFEERIRNVDSNTYNMLRETRFDNTDFVGWSGGPVRDDESIPYFVATNLSGITPWVSPLEPVTLESGKEYILSFDFRSEIVPEADYVWFTATDGGGDRNFLNDSIENTLYNLPTDGEWRRVYIRFTAWRSATGRIRMGSRFTVGNTDVGEFSIRLPYLTSSSNKEWVYHPLDATQSIEEVTRRITNLEDGRNELITRTEWDSESDYIMQTVRDIEETVDVSRNLIQEIENYEIILRGSEAIQTVDGFLDKVWLNDFSEIGANLIPQSSNAWEDGTFWSSGTNNNNSGGIRTKDYIEVIPGERYTFQDESAYVSAIQEVQIAQWDGDTRIGITHFVNRRNSRSFTAQGDRIRIGLTPMSGFGILPSYIDNIDDRIKMKLEKGDSATPFMNALSRVEQLADSFSVQIAELDGNYVTQSQFNITTGEVDTLVSRTDGHDTQIGNLTLSYDEISAIVVSINEDVESYGTWINQTDSLISSKVWMNDVADVQPNLIPMANFDYPQSRDFWSGTGGNATAVDSDGFYVYRSTNSGTQLGIFSPYFDLKSGYEYIFSVLVKNDSGVNVSYHWTALQGENTNFLGTPDRQTFLGDGIYRNEYIFTAENSGLTRIRIGAYVVSGNDLRIRIKEPKIERGNVRTPFLNSFSAVEQTAEEIRLAVQGIDGYGFLSQSDIQIRSNYVQLGSQRIDGDNLGSLLRVSPSGIDAIASAMRLSGDLYVAGDIEALAISAIKGEFASLWADEFEAITIDAEMITSGTMSAERIRVNDAFVNRIMAQSVFANEVTAITGDFVDINAGNIVTSGLSANVISSSHINSSNALIEKLFSNSARIDTLISKTHFVNEIKATSIDAVYADLRSVNSEIMSSNIIKADWIEGGTALFDKVFINNALIERLTSKSAFIRDIQAIEITANQLNIDTLQNKLGSVEGGLHIYGPDGRVLINNSIMPNRFDVQFVQPHFMGTGVTTSGNYFKTTNTSYSTAAAFSFYQAGRYLTVEGYCEMRGEVSGASRNTVGAIRLMEYSGGSRNSFVYINSRNDNNDSNQYYDITLDLGVPTYRQRNFYVQFYTANAENGAYFRINQAYYHG